MARRKIQEINAGSMADIAFLLLIFFLVTTTMEVDSGLGRTLPLKVDNITTPPVAERDVLEIQTNQNNKLMVEGNEVVFPELEEITAQFYLDNSDGKNNNPEMPLYTIVTPLECQTKINHFQERLIQAPNDRFIQSELSKWKIRHEICQLSGGQFAEISKSSVIRLQYDGKTSYGLYMDIQNSLKRVVNQLRNEKCKAFGWPDYFELNDQKEEDQRKIQILRLLVPERILENRF